MLMNYNKWFYDQHKYLTGNRNGNITFNDTKWADINDRYKTIIDEGWFSTISFDNLALDQLDVKRLLSNKQWDEFYMGRDSQYTFYIDLVDSKFAGNSLAPEDERYDILDSIDEMFEKIRKEQ